MIRLVEIGNLREVSKLSNRRSRDELVDVGLRARDISNACEHQKGPWIYKAKIKVGNRATINSERECTNIPHLYAESLMDHAIDRQTINIYGISRVMKASLRSQREDI